MDSATNTEAENTATNEQVCPECSSSELDDTVGEFDAVCEDCGLVVDDFSSVDPSKHEDQEQDNRADEMGVEESWAEFRSVSNSTEQRAASSIKILEQVGDAMSISSEVRIKAAEIFSQAAVEKLTDGRSTDSIIGAVVFIAARNEGRARPLPRLASVLDVDRSRVDQMVRLLHIELDLQYQGCQPEDYLPYLSTELGYDDQVVSYARLILDEARDAGLVNGRSPTGIAGAALYCSGNGERTQREVAKIAGVSKETIRIRIKEFRGEGIPHA